MTRIDTSIKRILKCSTQACGLLLMLFAYLTITILFVCRVVCFPGYVLNSSINYSRKTWKFCYDTCTNIMSVGISSYVISIKFLSPFFPWNFRIFRRFKNIEHPTKSSNEEKSSKNSSPTKFPVEEPTSEKVESENEDCSLENKNDSSECPLEDSNSSINAEFVHLDQGEATHSELPVENVEEKSSANSGFNDKSPTTASRGDEKSDISIELAEDEESSSGRATPNIHGSSAKKSDNEESNSGNVSSVYKPIDSKESTSVESSPGKCNEYSESTYSSTQPSSLESQSAEESFDARKPSPEFTYGKANLSHGTESEVHKTQYTEDKFCFKKMERIESESENTTESESLDES